MKWWPWVSKKRLAEVQNEYEAKRDCLQNEYVKLRTELKDEYSERKRMLYAAIQRLSDLQWHRDGRRYALTLSFDPRIISNGNCPRDELEMLAEHFSRQVHSDIVRSKLIHEAQEDARLQRRRGYC